MKNVVAQKAIERLRQGWSLSNRGMGWYLASPDEPGLQRVYFSLSDFEVMLLAWDGVIELSIHSGELRAELADSRHYLPLYRIPEADPEEFKRAVELGRTVVMESEGVVGTYHLWNGRIYVGGMRGHCDGA